MLPAGFVPAIQPSQLLLTHSVDCEAAGISNRSVMLGVNFSFTHFSRSWLLH
jgi:hypothetical protein